MRFELAEAINAGKARAVKWGEPPTSWPPMPPLPDMPYVNADAVSAHYWQAETTGFDLESNDFGIVKPPYPAMFFEWTVPSRMFTDGRWIDRPTSAQDPVRAALVFDEVGPEDGGGAFCMQFVASIRGTAVLWPFASTIRYDRHGVVQRWTKDELGPALVDCGPVLSPAISRATDPALDRLVRSDPDARRDHMSNAADWYHIVCMAVSFMHCKGAGTDWVTVPAKVAAKRRFGPSSYGVVRVPQLGGRTRRPDSSVPADQRMSAHWVRGHFKTYTSDARLFGQRTGSWWWQPTVRGAGDATRKPYLVEAR